MPTEAQDSLRRLSKQGRALTIQDKLFEEIVNSINNKCGAVESGMAYIESKLLKTKVIKIAHIECTDTCRGMYDANKTL